jgi:hypothetical protein
MKLKSIIPIALIGAVLVFAFMLVTGFISFSNQFVPDENNPLKTKEDYFDSYRPW